MLQYARTDERGPDVVMIPSGRPGPALVLQQQPDGAEGASLLPIVLDVPDLEQAIPQLEGAGAHRLCQAPLENSTPVLMADPEANEFWVAPCVTGGRYS